MIPSGEPTRDLQALARKGLRAKVRKLVKEALRTRSTTVDSAANVVRGGLLIPCRITVVPIIDSKARGPLALVVFEDRKSPHAPEPAERAEESSPESQLEKELRETRDDLQAVINDLERSNEELRSYNEEVLSMNEELQSLNEELETSKEELQSVNEEVTSANTQLNAKIEELNALNDDMSNLLDSTRIATVFLSPDLEVRRFTPAVCEYFRLLPGDVGRPISDVARSFVDDKLIEECREMRSSRTVIEREVLSTTGRCLVRRIMPYHARDPGVEGIVVTFVDVTELRRVAEELSFKEERLRLAINAASLLTFEWEPNSDRIEWSSRTVEMLGCEPRTMSELLRFVEEDPELPSLESGLRSAVEAHGHFRREFRMTSPDGTIRWVLCESLSLEGNHGLPPRMVGVLVDITDRIVLEASITHHMELLKTASRRLLQVQEAERKNFARELHDQVGQMLVVINMSLHGMMGERLSQGVRAKLRESLVLVARTVELVRELSLELRPPMLDDLGLVAAIGNKANKLAEAYGVAVTVSADESLGQTSSEVETCCYRIALEALTNAFSHAGPRAVRVHIRRESGKLRMTIEDDGCGFDVEKVLSDERGSIGLHSMRERAELVGGKVAITSVLGKGTSIQADFPDPTE